MYNVDKADRLLKRKLEKDPNYTKKLLEKIKQDNPEQFERTLMEDTYGRHIGDIDAYNDAVRNLKWVNGKGKGEKWDKDDLLRRANVDFNNEKFGEFDWLYAVQSLYADYGTISEDPKYYMEMANNYLHNEQYPERGDERAYYDAQRRARRNSPYNRYDGYGYSSHYDPYNTYDTYNTYNTYNRYDYENRKRYDRRADNDRDGRYNE